MRSRSCKLVSAPAPAPVFTFRSLVVGVLWLTILVRVSYFSCVLYYRFRLSFRCRSVRNRGFLLLQIVPRQNREQALAHLSLFPPFICRRLVALFFWPNPVFSGLFPLPTSNSPFCFSLPPPSDSSNMSIRRITKLLLKARSTCSCRPFPWPPNRRVVYVLE